MGYELNRSKKLSLDRCTTHNDDNHNVIPTEIDTEKQRPILLRPDTKSQRNENDVDDLENALKQQLNNNLSSNNVDTKICPDGFDLDKLHSVNNPYLDPLLMENLQRFSPQQNEEYMDTYKISDDDNHDDFGNVIKQ